jgi:SPP1 gp7 family putative phage head morphogenesis protein
MPDTVVSLALQYRQAVLQRDTAAMARLVNAYGGMYQRILKDVDRLVLKIENAGGTMTNGQVQRLAQYKDLIESIQVEVNQFGGYLKTSMSTEAQALMAQAGQDAKMLIATALGGDARVLGMIKMLNPDVVETLLGFLDPKGTLFSYWNEKAGIDVANRISQTIIDNVGMGKNPQVLARAIQGDLGNNLTSALRTARTVQLKSYREASRANFIANQDVITGYQWVAQLDSQTCEACIALNGTIYDLEITPENHWNCRCCVVPITILNPNPTRQSGEDWFNEQDAATQTKIMGVEKLAAYNDGKFSFADLVQRTEDTVWGHTLTVTPLKDLVPSE